MARLIKNRTGDTRKPFVYQGITFRPVTTEIVVKPYYALYYRAKIGRHFSLYANDISWIKHILPVEIESDENWAKAQGFVNAAEMYKSQIAAEKKERSKKTAQCVQCLCTFPKKQIVYIDGDRGCPWCRKCNKFWNG